MVPGMSFTDTQYSRSDGRCQIYLVVHDGLSRNDNIRIANDKSNKEIQIDLSKGQSCSEFICPERLFSLEICLSKMV